MNGPRSGNRESEDNDLQNTALAMPSSESVAVEAIPQVSHAVPELLL